MIDQVRIQLDDPVHVPHQHISGQCMRWGRLHLRQPLQVWHIKLKFPMQKYLPHVIWPFFKHKLAFLSPSKSWAMLNHLHLVTLHCNWYNEGTTFRYGFNVYFALYSAKLWTFPLHVSPLSAGEQKTHSGPLFRAAISQVDQKGEENVAVLCNLR